MSANWMLEQYMQVEILLVLIRVRVTTVKKVNNTIKGNKVNGVAIFFLSKRTKVVAQKADKT